jgi:hypothetical protein
LNREDGAGDAMMRALDEVYNPVQASSGTQGYIPRIEWDVAIMLLDLMGMAVLISHASLLAIYETNWFKNERCQTIRKSPVNVNALPDLRLDAIRNSRSDESWR